MIVGSTKYQTNFTVIKIKVWNKDRSIGRKCSSIVEKHVPEAITSYNNNMNSVDRLNRSIKSLKMRRGSRK